MEYLRVSHEARRALIINDPRPVDNIGGIWTSVGRAATVGTFLLLFGAFLYVGRVLVLPLMTAAIVALTLAPLVRAGKRRGISPWITALLLVVVCVGAVAIAATAMAGPVSEWIGRAPEIGTTIKQRLSALDRPLAALRQLQDALFGGDSGVSVNTPTANFVLPVVAFFTPAVGELLLFFAILLFFLGDQFELRAGIVSLFGSRDAKLRFLKIMNDIEKNLAGYLTVVTMINAALGIIVALGAWLLGLPNPAIFGLLAALLNYVPYVGPAVTVVILFGVGLVTFPSLGQALLAPAGLVALTTIEGHFITPTIIGRRLTLNPLMVLLALAFWTWIWGPFGAFLATPLCIIGLVVFNHLFPTDDGKLPD
ncbi:MAG: AI-2E family transporter [Xanthobacteraceae bacterium]